MVDASNSHRVFMAIDLPFTDGIKKLIGAVGALRIKQIFVLPEQFHLTLKFFGERSDSEVEEIDAKIRSAITISPFRLSMHGAGFFGSVYKPTVLWIGVERSAELMRLYDLLAMLFGRDREEIPHVTISRIKYGKIDDLKKLAEIVEEYRNFTFWSGDIDRIVLKESRLTPSGAVYTDLHVYRLIFS